MLGGHSVEDEEPKYGLSVTGTVPPDKVKTNAAAKKGDKLILTKPLGTGIVTTALKGGVIEEKEAEKAIEVMAELNHTAAELAQEYNVNACTDITGFGLLGHAYEMSAASKVGIRLYYSQVPLLAQVEELAEEGMVPGGAYRNREYLKDCVRINPSVGDVEASILFDPQTSGGLLIAVPSNESEELAEEMKKRGVKGEVIGDIIDMPGTVIVSD